ncbi:Conserved_hypothetical protein [Hexamita inflata]|uniref:Uncharacterized protein n=1 Tax=Hexamita inflata TaxID=28002 RepID=A0ABP1IT39_9EUKA
MSKTREVFGITVSTETFSVLKSLSQIVSRNQVVDLEVAVSYISQSVQNFVTSDTVLNELTIVLEKITQSTRKQISESIMAYYKQALPERYDLVREGFQALLSQSSVHHPPPQVSAVAKQTVSETPKRQVRKMSEQLVLNPLLRQLQKSKISATVEGRAVYENQLQESPECFSKPLHAQVEKTALFRQLQIPYEEVNLCQYHPSLFLLAAPPQYSFPKLKSLPSMQSYSSMQLEINYSNESHDDPDIIFDAPVYYKWLSNFPQQQLIRNPILSVKTKKPVPQHHSLLDITGVYTNYDSFLISILTQIKLMCAQSKSKKISYLEILSLLSKVKYFPPFKMFVDQIHYGNDARYIRFCNSYPSAYLKAVGIGGSVRLQVHCSKDIAKDTEISLLMDYFCCGPGVLFDKMTVFICSASSTDLKIASKLPSEASLRFLWKETSSGFGPSCVKKIIIWSTRIPFGIPLQQSVWAWKSRGTNGVLRDKFIYSSTMRTSESARAALICSTETCMTQSLGNVFLIYCNGTLLLFIYNIQRVN